MYNYGVNKIINQVKVDIDGATEQTLDVYGENVYLQNTGAATVYMDSRTGVDSTKFEIKSGVLTGPWLASGKLYFKGAGVSTIKAVFVEVV